LLRIFARPNFKDHVFLISQLYDRTQNCAAAEWQCGPHNSSAVRTFVTLGQIFHAQFLQCTPIPAYTSKLVSTKQSLSNIKKKKQEKEKDTWVASQEAHDLTSRHDACYH